MIDRLVRGLFKWSRFSNGGSMAITALLLISLFSALTVWLLTAPVTSSIELHQAPLMETQPAATTVVEHWQPKSNSQLQLLDLSDMQLHIICESILRTDIDSENWRVSADGIVLLRPKLLPDLGCDNDAEVSLQLRLTQSLWSLYHASARR